MGQFIQSLHMHETMNLAVHLVIVTTLGTLVLVGESQANDICSDDIFVELKEEVLEKHERADGNYSKGIEKSDKKPVWESSGSVKFAIWFKDEWWFIRLKENMGTTTGSLKSKGDQPCPELVGSQWTYLTVKGWQDANDNAMVSKTPVPTEEPPTEEPPTEEPPTEEPPTTQPPTTQPPTSEATTTPKSEASSKTSSSLFYLSL